MAMRLGCQNNGNGGAYYRCGTQPEEGEGGDILLERKSSKPTPSMFVDMYTNSDCSGELMYSYPMMFPAGCQGDTGYQCVPHSRTPDFAAKEGLTT